MENKNNEVTKVESSGNKNNQKGYGILSLMAMIIGIVIGSGIFAKNEGLIGSAGSVGAVAFSWILGALIVVTLVIAFLEVISITEIAGEQATLANWGRRLIGIKFGKFLGVYFALAYFPILMAGLFQLGSDYVIHSLSYFSGSDAAYNNFANNNPVGYWFAIIGVSALLLVVVATINAINKQSGKIFQNVGTAIKTIPLFFIIIVFVVMLLIGDIHFSSRDDVIMGVFAGATHSDGTWTIVYNFENEPIDPITINTIQEFFTNKGLIVNANGDWETILGTGTLLENAEKGGFDYSILIEDAQIDNLFKTSREFSTLFLAVMATMPAILFAFDGFLIAGSLSKEGKKSSSFRIAFITSIIVIIVIYLLYSLAILGLGTTSNSVHGAYGSISNAIYNTFDNETVAGVINALVTAIIAISILTTASGCNIASYRMSADLSVNNFVEDKNGVLLEKNKFGMNTKGSLIIMGIAIFWFIIGISFDAVLLAVVPGTGPLANNTISLFATDMIIVWAYFIYAVVIFGAILNRFNHKNLVNKNVAFLPAAIISIILVTIITVIFAGQVLLPGSGGVTAIWIAKILYTVIFFIYIGVIYFVIGLQTTTITGTVEVSAELQALADSGDEQAKIDVERINNKNKLAAEYFDITVEELHEQREAINRQLEEAKKQRESLAGSK